MTDQTTANPDILGSLINAMKSIDPNAIAVLQQMFPNDPAVNAAISLLPAFAPIIQYIESGVSSTGGIAAVINLILQDEPTVMAVLQKLFPGNPLLAEVVAIFPTLQPILQILAAAKASTAAA